MRTKQMNRAPRRITLAAGVASIAVACGVIYAQTASPPTPYTQIMRYNQTEGTTARFDAQRSGWVRLDHFIGPEKMNGFALQWKKKIENTPGGGVLSGGIVANGGLGITLAYLGASGNRTIAIDMDNGHVFFNRQYKAPPSAAPGACSSASLAEPTRNTPLTPPMPGPPTAAGQSAVGPNSQLPFGSVLGEPGAGIPPVKPGSYFATPGSFFGATGAKPYDGTPASAVAGAAYAATGPAGGGGGRGRGAAAGSGAPGGRGPVNADGGAGPGRGPGGASGTGRGPGGGGGGRGGFGVGNATYAISSDGVLHGLTAHDGLDGIQPIPFLPAGAQATDLIMIDGVLYTSTVNGCGGAPNGVWAITPSAIPAGGSFPKAVSWTTGGTASPHSLAFNADGVVFVTVGSGTGPFADSVVSLDAATLTVKSTYHLAGANFIGSPVIFRADARDIVAAQAADGRIVLLDGANLAMPLYTSAAAVGPGTYEPAGLATWQDSTGQRWLITTTATSVTAHKFTMNGGSASLLQGWMLGSLKAPLAPLVVNGVVFAASTGDATAPAVLYAVNGVTGQALWNSGKTITGSVPRSTSIWNSMGQVLLGASDGTLYAFGMNLDRHL